MAESHAPGELRYRSVELAAWRQALSSRFGSTDPISDRFTHPNNVLYVMRSDGTGLTKLIDTRDFKSSPEWWSP